jgi:ClpP class serine protease
MAFDPYDDDDDGDGERKTFSEAGYEVELGIAKIDIEGTTVMKLGGVRPFSGMTGYDGIRQNLVQAAADPRVKAIALDIDSPGGEVSGLFDLVDTVRAVDQNLKPVYALLTEQAFSAGYALASAARRIYVPRTGGTGSIGIVWMHCDFSRAIQDAGVKVTFVTRGSRKTDGAEQIPLAPEALARAQADIDAVGAIFEATVARNRGLSEIKIRDMQAGTFLGADSITVGLADDLMAPAEAFQDILERTG